MGPDVLIRLVAANLENGTHAESKRTHSARDCSCTLLMLLVPQSLHALTLVFGSLKAANLDRWSEPVGDGPCSPHTQNLSFL